MIKLGGTYSYGRLPIGEPEFIFVVVAKEPYFPPRPPSGYIPGPGFRILLLDGELTGPFHGTTKAGQETVVAESSGIACDAKLFDGGSDHAQGVR